MSFFSSAATTCIYHKRTRAALLLTNLLNEPFLMVYGFLAIILKKHMGATAFQIAFLTMLRPTMALFSFYWSSKIIYRKDKLRSNLVVAGFLSRLPFLFFPFIHNVWFMIFSAAIYTFFCRAAIPALIEILKRNLPKEPREKLFSVATMLGYLEGIVIGLVIGVILELISWKILFFGAAALGMLGVFIQNRIPIKGIDDKIDIEPSSFSFNKLLKPWKECFALMKRRKDFARFQWGFMICGFGIMVVQPAIPSFITNLNISYIDLAIAFSICKGLGFAFSSPLWVKGMKRLTISFLSSVIFFLVGCFPLILLLASQGVVWLYLSYLLYGIAQGGSHLIWHMSGPIFASDEDSSQFSRVNILTVGMRGLIAPMLGGVLCDMVGPVIVLILGMLFCFLGGWYIRKPYLKEEYSPQS